MREAGEASVKVNIAAPQGIENFKVEITSSSDTFMFGLTALGLHEEFDLANPTEALTAMLRQARTPEALAEGVALSR